jgi:hypothetical protein
LLTRRLRAFHMDAGSRATEMQTIEEQVALLQKRAEEHALLASFVSDARVKDFNMWAAREYQALLEQLRQVSLPKA